jgi:hypothetical protein
MEREVAGVEVRVGKERWRLERSSASAEAARVCTAGDAVTHSLQQVRG